MRRRPVSLARSFLLALLLGCSREAQRPAGEIPPHPAILEQSKEFPENYDAILADAWAGDTLGLGAMFGFEDLRAFTGAAADEHQRMLWAVLQHVGDEVFARALRPEPQRIRANVVAALAKAAGPPAVDRYPLTKGLAGK